MDYLIQSLKYTSICCALYLLYTLLRFGHRGKHLPPGPPTIPILGNAHLIPFNRFAEKLKEWSDRYGKIFSLKIGAGTIIGKFDLCAVPAVLDMLTDRRVVHDLIEKRSAIYSDRPIDQNMSVAMGDENLSMVDANAMWRAHRKIAAQELSPKVLDEKITHILEAESVSSEDYNAKHIVLSCQLTYDILQNPDAFLTHIKRVTASTSSIATFGQRAPTFDSFWASSVYTTMDSEWGINQTLEPGTYLPIEQFPILKLIPDSWAPSKARAKRCFENVSAFWLDARERIIERRRKGDERISLADKLLSGDVKCDVPMDARQLSNFLGGMHQGAAHTTSSIVLSHIRFLATHPWVQEKARVELDRVCGIKRMPMWTDFKALPYINCILKEGLRIRPVVPTGVPHRVRRDDWYEGYFIPKDSTIFFMPWAIHRTGGGLYEDPDTYNPDRYLNHPRLAVDYAQSPDYMNRDHYAYGGGRRICVGIHLAERMQWRLLARLLWAFKIEPAIDEQTGKQVELDMNAYARGLVADPLPYKVSFVPRSEKHAEVIRSDFEKAKDFLKKWE